MDTPHRVRFRGEKCSLAAHTYTNGRTALSLNYEDGELMAVATANLPNEELAHGEVFVKDYSENEGMLAALVEAGIVAPTGRVAHSGFAVLPVAKILVPLS